MVDSQQETSEIERPKIEFTSEVIKPLGFWLAQELDNNLQTIESALNSESLQAETSPSLREAIRIAKPQPEVIKRVIDGFKTAEKVIITPAEGGGDIDFVGKEDTSLRQGEAVIKGSDAINLAAAVADRIKNPLAHIYAAAELVYVRSEVPDTKKPADQIMKAAKASMWTISDQFSGSDEFRFNTTPEGKVEMTTWMTILPAEAHPLGKALLHATNRPIQIITEAIKKGRMEPNVPLPIGQGLHEELQLFETSLRNFLEIAKGLVESPQTRIKQKGLRPEFEFSREKPKVSFKTFLDWFKTLKTKKADKVVTISKSGNRLVVALNHNLHSFITPLASAAIFKERAELPERVRQIMDTIDKAVSEIDNGLEPLRGGGNIEIKEEASGMTRFVTPLSPSSSPFQKI